MNPTNLDSLKQLLSVSLLCLAHEGKVIRHKTGETLWMPTIEGRLDIGVALNLLDKADTFDAAGTIASKVRDYTIEHDFFPPQEFLRHYERLVADRYLYEEKLLANVDWWCAASLTRI